MALFIPEFINENKELQVLTEAYFGDKSIEPILKQLHKLREPYLDQGLMSNFINKFNTDPELFKLNRMVEKQFGFKTCSINVIPNKVINGCTYPISYRNFGSKKKNVIVTNTGFKFKEEAEYCLIIFIYAGCMFDSTFTDREIMGMILHEIGHNFSAALSNNLCTIRDIQHIISIPIALLRLLLLQKDGIFSFNNVTKVALNLEIKFKDKYPELCNFLDGVKGSFNFIGFLYSQLKDILVNLSIITNPIGMIINNIYRIVLSKLKNPIGFIFSLGGKEDEQLADNFATMYGYGEDNNSFLQKAEKLSPGIASKTIYDIPLFGALQQAVIIPIECTMYAFDPHPKSIYRSMDAIKYLELELNNSTSDPKMRKEIKKQINELNNILDQYTEEAFDFSGDDVRAAYNEALINIYENRPRKKIEKMYKDIDKIYNDKK